MAMQVTLEDSKSKAHNEQDVSGWGGFVEGLELV